MPAMTRKEGGKEVCGWVGGGGGVSVSLELCVIAAITESAITQVLFDRSVKTVHKARVNSVMVS